jgi:hypothetical protein
MQSTTTGAPNFNLPQFPQQGQTGSTVQQFPSTPGTLQQPTLGQPSQLGQLGQPSPLGQLPTQQQPQQPGTSTSTSTSTAPFETQIIQSGVGGYEVLFISNMQQDVLFVDIHMNINGGVQMNYRMEPITSRRYSHKRISLNTGDVLRWTFSYALGASTLTTQAFSFTAPASSQPQGAIPQGGQPVFGNQPTGLPQLQGGQPVFGGNQPSGLPQAPLQSGLPQFGAQPGMQQTQQQQLQMPQFPQQPTFGTTGLPQQLPSQPTSQLPTMPQQQQLPTIPSQTGGTTAFPNSQTIPTPLPAGTVCTNTDYECQLRKLCNPCFTNPTMPMCSVCLSLQNCGTTACQISQTCSLCKMASAADKPLVCSLVMCS